MVSGVERKLTNVFSADVFGYSRLMGADEAATLATLNAYRALMSDLINRHRGRVISTAGDHMLAEFASAVMAVQCSVEIQDKLAECNQRLAPERQMWFRIGLNLGDVIVENDDLFGDDVNIAARLQAMAEPGGILVSGPVFVQVKNRIAIGFEPLGPQRLRNIEAAVEVYRVELRRDAGLPRPPAERVESQVGAKSDRQAQWHRFYVSAGRAMLIVGFFLAVNIFGWDGEIWFQWPSLIVLFILGLRATYIFRH